MKKSKYYDSGWSAALADGDIDSCNLIKHNRRAEWMQGFHDATQQMEERAEELTAQQQKINKDNISCLLAFLDG